MQIEARVRTRFLKPTKGWKSVDVRDAVGKLTLEATRPDDTQLLRYLYWTLSKYGDRPASIVIRAKGKKVCEWKAVAPTSEKET